MAEVKEAFFDIDVESAPGPDGYTSAFYRSAWPVIGQTLFQAIGEFFRTGKLLKQVNTTLIALIPKVNLPMYVSDYRPIACCNVLYKAITKIIVKRMQRVLPLLIDYSQNAFVPGRSITDKYPISSRTIGSWKWECESSLGTDLQTKRGRRAWSSQPHHNKSGLMLKQLWRIIQNDGTSIWVDWIQHYRLRQSTIWTFNGALGSWGWRKMLNLRPLLQRGVIYKVGDGSSFSLWQDIWHERGPLCLLYPRGPTVTGLPLSSLLSSVIQRNQWCWPGSTDAELQTSFTASSNKRYSSRHHFLEKAARVSTHSDYNAACLLAWTSSGKFKIRGTDLFFGWPYWKNYTMDKPWVPSAENGCVLCGGCLMKHMITCFLNAGTLSVV
ncbi:UNVERIFIED_CONTAM: hypothetical protein Sradi_7247600 [Sesamum radiatum]|uniref:Reverse transcriptase domain-containing protein n=1 Tax=Sesamum radiatum TaxID=300843 RepID=A0AAW2ILQ3_SESRA